MTDKNEITKLKKKVAKLESIIEEILATGVLKYPWVSAEHKRKEEERQRKDNVNYLYTQMLNHRNGYK